MMDFKELYRVEKVSDQVVLVFSTTYVNPISYLSVIEEDLSELDFSGKVVFDLLLSNGCSSNRFIEVDVSKSKIDIKSMKVVDVSKLNKSIIDRTYNFYKNHPDLVSSNHILMDEEKYHLLHESQVLIEHN